MAGKKNMSLVTFKWAHIKVLNHGNILLRPTKSIISLTTSHTLTHTRTHKGICEVLRLTFVFTL